MKIKLDIVPPKSTGQAAATILKRGDRYFVGKKSNSEGKRIQDMLWALLMEHKPATPYVGPLAFTITYVYPWRKSEPKKNRVHGFRWMDKKPDADNIPKILQDVMTRLQYWGDDSQIAVLGVRKLWGDDAKVGIFLELKQITETEIQL
jgi:Holliday junction resolvase RusA-like endonuclease